MDTLINGKEVSVNYEDGTAGIVSVGQLKLRDYKRAFAASEDEMQLTSILCGKPDNWALSLTPQSYETLVVETRSANKDGFFIYAQRQAARLMERMNRLSPEVLQTAMANGKALKDSSRGLQPQ